MNKLPSCFLVLFLIISLAACSSVNTAPMFGKDPISSQGVSSISVSTLPDSQNYARTYTSPDKLKAITDYIDSLHLSESFPENPDAYVGMTWVITYRYTDGTSLTMYHFGNMFFRVETGTWKRMTYEEANRFSDLISQNPSDEKST